MNQPSAKDESLIPNNYLTVEHEFNEQQHFRKLQEISQTHFEKELCSLEQYEHEHAQYFKVLNQEDINTIEQHVKSEQGLTFCEDTYHILQKIFSPDVDRAIKNYLKSHYAVVFFSYREIDSRDTQTCPSLRWHCDGIAENQMVLMTYLNGDEEHGSSTLWMEEEVTQKLKQIGYAYCPLWERKMDIEALLDEHQLDNTINRHSFQAGEMIALCPTRVLHRAEQVTGNSVRKTFDVCILPSPIPWQEAIQKGYRPASQYVASHGQAKLLLNKALSIPVEDLGEDLITIAASGKISTPECFKFHLDTIFSNKKLVQDLFEQLSSQGTDVLTLTAPDLITKLKNLFHTQIDWKMQFTDDVFQNLSDVLNYDRNYLNSALAYNIDNQKKAEKRLWPVPNHFKYPRCKYDLIPYVNTHKIMDRTTPIGSAGSCFAVEIAKVLQEDNYNYVVTELADSPDEEALADGYEVGSGKAQYSANFGILFNTPSLRQLAEKAFDEKQFKKYLIELENGFFMDPYRENVFFKSRKNYLQDYPKHVEAVRRVFTESKVFVFTVGLNECWQMHDGTVISRNPRGHFQHLIKHRVLTVEENVQNIKQFYYLVKKHNPDFKLILSLSPVPLIATARWRDHHIIEANTHSKSVLRVAIDQVVSELEDVYYLPSYELVMECTENPWEEDHRHVTRDTVKRVIGMFNEIFVRS